MVCDRQQRLADEARVIEILFLRSAGIEAILQPDLQYKKAVRPSFAVLFSLQIHIPATAYIALTLFDSSFVPKSVVTRWLFKQDI